MKLTNILAAAVVASVSLLSSPGQSAPVTLNLENGNLGGFFGVAVDPVTGKVYKRNHFFNGSGVAVYNSQSDFAAGQPSNSITLAGGNDFGTYFAVNNGVIYGRDSTLRDGNNWPTDARVSKWNATTGAKIAGPVVIPGMGGQNGVDTYNWGGFSGVNVNQDSTGLYVVGGVLNANTWQVTKIDQSLNILGTTSVAGANEGYGFVINGVYFASSNFYSNTIDIRVDLATGIQTTVNYVLTGGFGSPYWMNASYDYASDTLRLGQLNTGVFVVSNASAAFNAPSTTTPVPAPGALALLGLGLLGIGGLRRNSRQSVHTSI
jgi:hypothetical protein